MKTRILKSFLVLVLTVFIAAEARAYFDPHIGRWASRDPIGDESFIVLHGQSRTERKQLRREALKPLYVFVGNQSVGRTDKFGLSWIDDILDQIKEDLTEQDIVPIWYCFKQGERTTGVRVPFTTSTYFECLKYCDYLCFSKSGGQLQIQNFTITRLRGWPCAKEGIFFFQFP